MTIRARSLCVVAGLALTVPFALGAGGGGADQHATPPAKHEDARAAKPSAKPAAKARPSIWDSAKSKAKPAEKAEPKAAPKAEPKQHAPAHDDHEGGAHDEHADDTHAAPAHADENAHDDHDAPKAAHGAKAKSTAARHAPAAQAAGGDGAVSADEAIAMLQEGNRRWVSGETTNPSTDAGRREDVAANGQRPFVTVLTCADSRIPVERVFDRGVGEVFTVRVAGNVAGDSETGTIEYGVGHLKTGLLVVMGHTRCGAVAAACSGAQVHGKVAGLIEHVKPAVERAKRNNPNAGESELAAIVERENVWQSVYDLLKHSEDVRGMVSRHEVKVVGALYDISTGGVEFLGEHPWQGELITAMTPAGGTTHAAHDGAPASTPTTTTHGTTMTVSVDGDEHGEDTDTANH